MTRMNHFSTICALIKDYYDKNKSTFEYKVESICSGVATRHMLWSLAPNTASFIGSMALAPTKTNSMALPSIWVLKNT